MLIALLVISVAFVAFTNGANANFKGVASLYGSGTTSLRRAALWGTLTTFAGSVASIFLAEGILKAFGGKGVVSDALTQSPEFICAVALGGAFTSFFATRLGFPVSTTHALVGALIGAGLVGGGSVNLAGLWEVFFLPLFTSPLIAIALGGLVYLVLRKLKLAPDQRTPTLDTLHFLSTGAASFARGLNDTPKMAALLVLVPNLEITWSFLLVGCVIALGGLLDIQRVAETLGKKITDMDAGQGFSASLVTASLVATASLHSYSVSTTHVSVGSLLGMGIVTRQARWKMVVEILLAWVSTVPCGAVLAAIAYAIISLF